MTGHAPETRAAPECRADSNGRSTGLEPFQAHGRGPDSAGMKNKEPDRPASEGTYNSVEQSGGTYDLCHYAITAHL